jgi:hypothetical protein
VDANEEVGGVTPVAEKGGGWYLNKWIKNRETVMKLEMKRLIHEMTGGGARGSRGG